MKILERLIYRSRVVTLEGESPSLDEILTVSRRNNTRDSITGVLIMTGDRFVQVVEGPPESIGRLWARLNIDTRHSHLQLIGCVEISARLFPGWSMITVADASASQETQRLAADSETSPAVVCGLLLKLTANQHAEAII